MKKVINKLIFIFFLLPLLTGCEKDKEIVVVEPIINYTQLYVLGEAFGGDSNSPTSMNMTEANVFTIDKELQKTDDNKLFKFILEKGDWDKVRYLVPTEVDKDKSSKAITAGEYDMFLCSESAGNLRDHFWGIPEGADGNYRLTVNMQTMKLKIEKLNN